MEKQVFDNVSLIKGEESDHFHFYIGGTIKDNLFSSSERYIEIGDKIYLDGLWYEIISLPVKQNKIYNYKIKPYRF